MFLRLATFTLLLVTACAPAAAIPNQVPEPQGRIFRFDADGFWLNLHHFLYVLGRANARLPDAARDSVAGASGDAERGAASLSAEERQAWTDAVAFYTRTISPKDILFDPPLVEITGTLATIEGATVPAAGVLATVAAQLNAAAPAYRKAWWPAHRAANERWAQATTALVEKHGRAVLDFITRAYGLTWKEGGHLIHVAAYANWAGAYSVTDGLIIISSLDPGGAGLRGLESAFHESMHQWDDEVSGMLERQAAAVSRSVPFWLDHAVLFYTAGAAVRSVVPDYTPTADVAGIWQRSGRPFKPALDEVWAPYLRGEGTRDQAFAELLRRTGRPR